MRNSRDPKELLDGLERLAHDRAADARRLRALVELANEGARELGFKDTGALWRVEVRHAARRLRRRDRAALEAGQAALRRAALLRARPGSTRSTATTRCRSTSPIPAHLLGNMWAQEWEQHLRRGRAAQAPSPATT